MKDDGQGGGEDGDEGGGEGSDEDVMKVLNDWILAVWGVLMTDGLTDICDGRVASATEKNYWYRICVLWTDHTNK